MMKQLILILLLFTSIYAQYEWSVPMQLSDVGTHPDTGYTYPAITVDSSGTIHAFWVFDQSPDGTSYTRYSQIEYSRSTDGGLNWSPVENITPEYTTEGKRIFYMRAVCDSDNNVHLFYQRSYAPPDDIFYRRYDGSNWTEPVLLANNGNVKLLANIDTDDRIYVTWVSNNTFYRYCDLKDSIPEWSELDYILHDGNRLSTNGFIFDTDNNIYAIGTIDLDPEKYRPYYYFYDRSLEGWTYHKPVGNYQTKSLGEGIVLSDSDSLYVNVSIGNDLANNLDDHLEKYILDFNFTSTSIFGEDNNWEREMYIDECNYIHLFVKHYYNANTMGDTGILHNMCRNGVWTSVAIDSSQNHSYTAPRVALDKKNNKFYLIYSKFDRRDSTTRIFIQSRLNESGIEDSNELLVTSYELEQNYPNPFNSQTKIEYSIKKSNMVEIGLYNIKGELVKILVNQKMKQGVYSVLADLEQFNSGVYFYRLKLDGMIKETRKMLYLE